MKLLPNTVINFHAIYDVVWMDKVLRLLKRLYKPVPIQDIEGFFYQKKPLKNTCHITFDDGDASFYHTVFPLLKKYNFPASIYVSSKATVDRTNFWFQEIRGYNKATLLEIIKTTNHYPKSLNKDLPPGAVLKTMKLQDIWRVIGKYQEITNTAPKECLNMNAKQIKELHNSGLVSIGAHTLNHPILKNEADEIAKKEIIQSVHDLSNILGEQIKYFAYPNGIPDLDFGEREKQLVKKAGCTLAFSTKTKKLSRKDDYFSIPRNGLTKGSRLFIISKLLAGKHWLKIKRHWGRRSLKTLSGQENRLSNAHIST